MELRRIQAARDFPRVAHLRVRQTGISETVNENADRRFGRLLGSVRYATNLGLHRNAPILFEGRAVETHIGSQSLVTFEIPPRVSWHDPTIGGEYLSSRRPAADCAHQGRIANRIT